MTLSSFFEDIELRFEVRAARRSCPSHPYQVDLFNQTFPTPILSTKWVAQIGAIHILRQPKWGVRRPLPPLFRLTSRLNSPIYFVSLIQLLNEQGLQVDFWISLDSIEICLIGAPLIQDYKAIFWLIVHTNQ